MKINTISKLVVSASLDRIRTNLSSWTRMISTMVILLPSLWTWRQKQMITKLSANKNSIRKRQRNKGKRQLKRPPKRRSRKKSWRKKKKLRRRRLQKLLKRRKFKWIKRQPKREKSARKKSMNSWRWRRSKFQMTHRLWRHIRSPLPSLLKTTSQRVQSSMLHPPYHLQKASRYKKSSRVATTPRSRMRRTLSVALWMRSLSPRILRPLATWPVFSISHRHLSQTVNLSTASLFKLENLSKKAKLRARWRAC